MTTSSPDSADIFCRVIDNFGDAGVTLRLARRLRDLGVHPRLVVDRRDVLKKLLPALALERESECADGIEVWDWDAFDAASAAGRVRPAPLTLETFGCRLPDSVEAGIEAMRAEREAAGLPPDGDGVLYVNLDYLSAESWVEDCHEVRGLHPTRAIAKLWYFPGFTDRTAGVLIEDDYKAREAAFAAHRDETLACWGADPTLPTLFVFTYPVNPLETLAKAVRSFGPVNVILAEDKAAEPLSAQLSGVPGLRIVRPGFLAQADFDEVLWASDAVVVRGEDSFVRAQLAGKPLLWSTYPTEDKAHLVKMDAWLERFVPVLDTVSPEAAAVFQRANRAWVTSEADPEELALWWRERAAVAEGARLWREMLFTRGDLARRLLERTQKPA